MTEKEVNQHRKKTEQLLNEMRIVEALDSLNIMVKATANWDITDVFEQIKTSYDLMLMYLSQGVLDSKREQIHSRLILSMMNLLNMCEIALKRENSVELYYVRSASMTNKPLSNFIEAYKRAFNKLNLLQSVKKEEQNVTAIMSCLDETERAEVNLFNKIWTLYPTSNNDKGLIDNFLTDNNIALHSRCLIASALLLALMKFYDENKLLTLINCYLSDVPVELQLRALSGAVLSMFLHDKTVRHSEAVQRSVLMMEEHPYFVSDLKSLFKRLIKSRNTERLTEKVLSDFLPNLIDLKSDFIKNFNEQNFNGFSDLEANPEWLDRMEKSGLMKQMEDLNEIQTEGGDVYMSTFSKLKSFPFFQTLSNWFMPFHTEHSIIKKEFGADESLLSSTLKSMPYLCNSDKFSMLLSMASLGDNERKSILSHLDAQNNEIKADNKSSLPDEESTRDNVLNMYLQDLYRFFNLYSRRNEFYPLFKSRFNLLTVPFISHYVNTSETVGLIAEFYFKNGFYDDAIYYFKRYLNFDDAPTVQVMQKIGFAYQNKGKYNEALSYYRNCEIADGGDEWTLRHIASCYRSMKNASSALEYYKKVEELSPENSANCMNIGHCLLEMGKVTEAQKYYFKADLLNDKNHRSWRAIAWCAFLTGNYQQATSYYERISENDKLTAQDLLNYGHTLLMSGEMTRAIVLYTQSLKEMKGDTDAFCKAFFNDERYLTGKFNRADLALCVDSAIKNFKSI